MRAKRKTLIQRALALVLMYVFFASQSNAQDVILSPGSIWEYTFTDPTSNSSWNKITRSGGRIWSSDAAPFGTKSTGDFGKNTYWEADGSDGDDLWVRRILDLTGYDPSAVAWDLGVDNGFTLFINGQLVASENAGGFTSRWEYSGDFSKVSLNPGLNVLAVALEDHGGETAFDMRITVASGGEWQSIICKGVAGKKAKSDLIGAIVKLEQASENAVQKIPALPEGIMYRSSRPTTVRFDDRRKIIAQMIKNRGTDNYLQEAVRNGAVWQFRHLARRSLRYPKKGWAFDRSDLEHYHVTFESKVNDIRGHVMKAISGVNSKKVKFQKLMDRVDGGEPEKMFGVKAGMFMGNQLLKDVLPTVSSYAGIFSLLKSSIDVLFAMKDLQLLDNAALSKNLYLEELEELAYLSALYAQYLSIFDVQKKILNCHEAGSGE